MAAVDFDIPERYRARAASTRSDVHPGWKWLFRKLPGKALIRKTSRAPCTPGCFNRAVTVSPQAGPLGWNTEQNNRFAQCSTGVTPIISNVTRGRRACRSKDKDLGAVVVKKDDENFLLLRGSPCLLEGGGGHSWSHMATSLCLFWSLEPHVRFWKHFRLGKGWGALEFESQFISVLRKASPFL